MQRLPTWVLGYHGCDESIGEAVLASNAKHLTFSTNKYDSAGPGG
jgi:hypothetical protein